MDYLAFQSLVVTLQLLMLFSVRGEAMTYGNSAGCNYVTGKEIYSRSHTKLTLLKVTPTDNHLFILEET